MFENTAKWYGISEPIKFLIQESFRLQFCLTHTNYVETFVI